MADPPRPAPGWYPDPDGIRTQRWWDGNKWADEVAPEGTSPPPPHEGPPPPPPPPPGQTPPPPPPQPAQVAPVELKEAYVARPRTRVGGIVARICAVGLMLGLVGGLTQAGQHTLPDPSETPIFDIARYERPNYIEKKLPPFGFFIGPALIILLLPIARGRPRVYFRRRYLVGVGIATLLWVTGLVILIAEVSSLPDRFTIGVGAYIGTALITVGLAATLAMVPAGLQVVQVDKKGRMAPPLA